MARKKTIKRGTSNPVIEINGRTEALDYFKRQSETDMWSTCYTRELVVVGIDNNPIYMACLKTDLDMEHVEDERLRECMDSYKLGVSFPTETKMLTYPIRDTAFKTLCERSSISGKALSTTEEKTWLEEVSPEEKQTIFNICLKRHKNKSLVLVRDGAVSAVLSGDENDYRRMPVIELINVLEETLGDVVSDFELRNATCDYEIAQVNYEIFDKDMVKNVTDTFRPIIKSGSCKIFVKLVTSDVGLSGANLFPFVEFDNGKLMLLGDPLSTTHIGAGAFATFKMNCEKMYVNYLENAKKIMSLRNIRIKNGGGCCRNIACEIGFPKKESINATLALDEMENCTAFDVYSTLFDIVEEMHYEAQSADTPLSQLQSIKEMERCARAIPMLLKDSRKLDHPFEWKVKNN